MSMSALSQDQWVVILGHLQAAARNLWQFQKYGLANETKFAEETQTQFLVADLIDRIRRSEDSVRSGLEVRPFTKPEEGKGGRSANPTHADLALWFRLPGRYFGIHFQAKSNVRIDKRDFGSFSPGKAQHDGLVRSAEFALAVPAYLFYPSPLRPAPAAWLTEDELSSFGCAAVEARFDPAGYFPKSAKVDVLAKSWVPWHEFVRSSPWIGTLNTLLPPGLLRMIFADPTHPAMSEWSNPDVYLGSKPIARQLPWYLDPSGQSRIADDEWIAPDLDQPHDLPSDRNLSWIPSVALVMGASTDVT